MRVRTFLREKVLRSAFAPVDIASLVFFRIAFGLLVIGMVHRIWSYHGIAQWWIDSHFLFKYPGFAWVHPWPGNWLYIHWAALGLLALFIAIGFLYRISAVLFFLGFSYFFLLDQGRYANHWYLICLFGFLLIFIPAHRAFSIDAWLRPKLRSQAIPAWTLWLLRAQMAAVYFFAGVAKITPDWLRGEPLRMWWSHGHHFWLLDRLAKEEWAIYVASYGALLVDLFLAPLLLWRRTRTAAFFVAVIFHLLNALTFPIDIFPWLAIAATTLFLSPGWPRRIISLFRRGGPRPVMEQGDLPARGGQLLVSSFVAIYIAIQIFVPLRHFLYSGGIEWTYMEHRFSWQMLLRNEVTTTFFYVTDPNTGHETQIAPEEYLDGFQIARMGWRPDMVLQFARFLASQMPRYGPEPLRVEARMFVSINGRRPRLFIDPNLNLAAEPRTLGRPRWLLQIREPLPPRGQDFSGSPFAGSGQEDRF